VTVQRFFKQDGDKVKARTAYSLDYRMDTWDKELIDAAVLRRVTIFRDFLKEKYVESSRAGQWMRHEPFAIVIAVLLRVLIAMRTLKKNANWFGYIFGFFLIFLLFYT
jgi:hypothetical protein